MDVENLKDKVIDVTLDKVVFEKDGFLIARVFSDTKDIQNFLNPIYDNISIKGRMPNLKSGITYTATISKAEKNKYGTTLSVISVFPKGLNADDIVTDDKLVTFVEMFIGEGTAKKIKGVKNILEIVKNGDKDSLMEIEGIGEYYAQKILDTYKKEAVGSKYIVELKHLGFTDREISKLDDFYDSDLFMAYENIKNNIFNLVYYGFRLDRMDKIFLEGLKGSKKDSRRINAYIWKALKDAMYERYKSYIYLDDFYDLDIIKNIESAVERHLIETCMQSLVDSKKIKIINNEIITTYDEWSIEKKLMTLLNDICDNITPKSIDIDDIEKGIDEQEEIMGFKLNEGQRNAVKSILNSDKAINVLTGFAGTGKTTVTKAILNIYAKYGRDNFKLCALSGRASSILGESSGYPHLAGTIHRTIGLYSEDGFTYENKFPDDIDILLVDEISMLDYRMLYSVLAPSNKNIKIIMLGDSGQLPSLSFGRTIETLDLFNINHCYLTQVMRQSEDAYILKVANEVREGCLPFKETKYTWLGNDTEVCIGDSYNYMIKSFIEKFQENPSSTIVVTTTKANTDMINFDIQKKLIEMKLLKKSKEYISKPSNTNGRNYEMYIGDYIMILSNNYNCTDFTGHTKEDWRTLQLIKELGEYSEETRDLYGFMKNVPIFNGEIYKIKDIFDGMAIISDGKCDILIENNDVNCQLAYASNCHKCQGSTFYNVFVYTTDSYVDRKMIVSREWLYTAYSRAKGYLGIHTNKYYNLSEGIKRKAIDEKVTLIEYFNNIDKGWRN